MPLVSSSRSSFDYEKVKSEACKPVKERHKILKTKRGKQIPRRYHLLDEKLVALIKEKEETGIFPNPFRKDGVYYNFLQALINLGPNKRHSFIDVKKEMKNLMQSRVDKRGKNLWEAFSDKKSENGSSNWDVNTRIDHTGKILQRINSCHPYGYKLKQLNSGIQIFIGPHKLPAYELKTDFPNQESVVTYNEYKSRRNKI